MTLYCHAAHRNDVAIPAQAVSSISFVILVKARQIWREQIWSHFSAPEG
jgi:hypothetical protein